MDRRSLLDRCSRSREERLLLAHVLDKYEQCRNRNAPVRTDFLSPAEQQSAEDLLRAAAIHDGWRLCGGYDRAERRMLFFLPEWQEEPEAEAEANIAALRAVFRAEDKPTHRDILGSLTALGLSRAKLGDILLSEGSADVLVCSDTAEYLLREWRGAGRARLHVRQISLRELAVPEQKVRELRDTVATLRLDAVTAAGFSLSRSKAAELIAGGRVQLNHRETVKPDAQLAEGDVVSARGFGKFELASAGGRSKKGRTAILIRRYL